MVRIILTTREFLMIETPTQNLSSPLLLLRKWGGVAVDGILDETCLTFSVPDIDGIIGYRIYCGNAVVFGDPVCAPNDSGALASAFQEYCESQKLGVIYTVTTEKFTHWAQEHLSSAIVRFGDLLLIDTDCNKTGSKAALVAKKVKRSQREGVFVKEYLGDDPVIENKIEKLAFDWVKGRKGPQLYLTRAKLFEHRKGKRWFYAQCGDNVVGFLILNALEAQESWLINNLMLSSAAPSGTSELLIVTALRTTQQENCRFLIEGPVPSKSLSEIAGLNPLLKAITRLLYYASKRLFGLEGQTIFWEKFQPKREGVYLIFPKKNLNYSSIRAIFKAYHVNS